ncbi:hypothetical protein G6F62_004537 [Rhizopus arrhizus]|nr:hypothetical protein G6F24_008338 [Rhizopus arrhizus]KAG0786195.1 hypothetical protein G6F21_008763 [Rhizopus arrhizus]KAG0815530.1 hypothetical protein G6F20_003911 [Rhizopus arrhizus]KAG0836762.1 hypothetical protein G6F19_004058 [Rhizopus arrhizus]KAG0840354.1 hypothetical protein G6F18_003712 [Rhizopus arrhizus]
MRLYSFGFDGFEQTRNDNQVKKILFTSWETTVVINEREELMVWGYQPDYMTPLLAQDPQSIRSFFGDPNHGMGLVTKDNRALVVRPVGERSEFEDIQQGLFSQGSLFLLTTAGTLYRQQQKIALPKVLSMHGSSEHVLCVTTEGLFGIGSNRFHQLGTHSTSQPVLIEHFEGLDLGQVSLACGPFHSAVVIGGDLYTFGFQKEGRLGWGEKRDEVVDLAVFLDGKGQGVEVNVIKVACGSCHTIVLDDEGKVWSCGSNKYGQLGRLTTKDYDLSKVVSRKHAEIFVDNELVYIRDTGSSSGTFLNNKRLSPPNECSPAFILRNNDIIQLGVDYQGGTEEIYRCVRMRIELNDNEKEYSSQQYNIKTYHSIQNLTKRKVNEDVHVEECCICLYAIAPFQALFVAPCSHTFHYKCLRPLLANHPGFVCPLCRHYSDLDANVSVEVEEVKTMLTSLKEA